MRTASHGAECRSRRLVRLSPEPPSGRQRRSPARRDKIVAGELHDMINRD
jgi:hypothetical protein